MTRLPFDDLPEVTAEAALELARRGVPVFPCDPDTKKPLTGSGGFHKATTNLRQVDGWFLRQLSNRGALIGMPTGLVSGFVVLDIDAPDEHRRKEDGFASLDVLERNGFSIAGSPFQVRTAGDGRHVYFRCPPGGLKSRAPMLPGIDLKADGGYVIVPPSRRPNGTGWEVDHA